MLFRHVLVTGGAGFIGSHFARFCCEKQTTRVTVLDGLTAVGNLENLRDLFENPSFRFVHGDVCDPRVVEPLFASGVDAVVHFAAESHVDRSIRDPSIFAHTNIIGTQVLLEAARKNGVDRFLQISTDEVYGFLGESGHFTETSPLHPSSPYSASKAAADLIALSYYKTFGLPVVITRCSNNYGPYQFPEKLIPVLIEKALADEPLPLYGDGQHVRDWLHVADHCTAIALVLERGRIGEVYNIGGFGERTNLTVARMVLERLGKPESLISFVADRPGHDRRYGIDPSKIMVELGWRPHYSFEQGLQETIAWYVDNRHWVESIQSGAYRSLTPDALRPRKRMS